MEKKWIIFYICFLIGIGVVLSYTPYGSPHEFGNVSTTTCKIGGDYGELNCTGVISIRGTGDNFFLGDVGIGTTSPASKLSVYTTDWDTSPLVNISNLDVNSPDADALLVRGGALSANSNIFEVQDYSGNTEFVVLGDGDVGIGTAVPYHKLEVSTAGINVLMLRDTGEDTGYDSWLAFNTGTGSSTATNFVSGVRGTISQGHPSVLKGELSFWTNRGDSSQEAVRISDEGYVGIGETTPTYPLTVTGNVSNISIYASHQVSATGYITRTSIWDKTKNVWDYIKDANYYKKDDKIDHSKFYGYVSYDVNVTDYSIPVNITQNKTYFNETTNQTEIEFYEIVTYPFTKIKTEEGVLLDSEIDLLRQAVYELKQENILQDNEIITLKAENQLIKLAFCKEFPNNALCKVK